MSRKMRLRRRHYWNLYRFGGISDSGGGGSENIPPSQPAPKIDPNAIHDDSGNIIRDDSGNVVVDDSGN